MRIIIGRGIKNKSETILDSEINYKEGLILDFPAPATQMKVSIVKDNNKKPVLVLLFD